MSQTILVTGAQGFIGRYMVAELLRRDPANRVIGLGRSPECRTAFTHSVTLRGQHIPAPLPEPLLAAAADPRYLYRQADMTDAAAVSAIFAEFTPAIVVHLASTRREEGAERLIHGNIQGMRTLAEVCRASGSVRHFVYGSSGGVYGIPAELPLRESTPCAPADPYGASKLSAEHFGRILFAQAGISFVSGRIFNVLGPGQEERHVCGRLACELSAIRHANRAPVISLGGLEATRDFIDVRDVASALAVLAARSEPDIYNIGTGVETSVGRVWDLLLDASGLRENVRLELLPGGPGPVARHVACMKKSTAIGIQNRYALDASLKEVLCYYRPI